MSDDWGAEQALEPPEVLPLFPLTGALLLPGGRLPLFLFEKRYVHMVEDALAHGHCIGIVQPTLPRLRDNFGEGADELPELFRVGCAGRIEHWELLPPEGAHADDRYLILLTGLSRFRIRRELGLHRGYRRAQVDYAEFFHDAADAKAELGPEPLLAALEDFGRSNNLALQLDRLGEISGMALLNSMAMALPFAPSEKQALLEAPNIVERRELLLTLLQMGLELRADSRLAIH